MMKPIGSRAWRWITLGTVLFNVCFNYMYQTISEVPPVKEVSDAYPNLFTPAPYAFSIWGLIYFSFLVYAVLQVLPSSKHKLYFDTLSIPFAAANLLASLWIAAFGHYMTGLSMLIILAMLGLSMVLFNRAYSLNYEGIASSWLLVPFSLFMAWLSVASIANISVWLVSMNVQISTSWTVYLTILMLNAAAVLGLWIGLAKLNWMYPMVIGWALIAIYMKQYEAVKPVGNIAFLWGAVMVILTLFLAMGKLKGFKTRGIRHAAANKQTLSV